MTEASWTEVKSEQGQSVRWTNDPANKWQEENTAYYGDVIEGQYIDKREGVGPNESVIYVVKTVEHGLLNIWGTTVLDERMKEVPLMSDVQINFTGLVTPKKGGKPYATFKVLYREAPMTEAGTQIPQAE